jgi:hypothetical protein
MQAKQLSAQATTMPWACGVKDCSNVFASYAELSTHIKSSHPTTHVYQCTEPNCGFGSNASTLYITHAKTAHLEPPIG